ncbi:Hypothetical protein NTJ_11846 [Nesidiocoris tenuis]|uniref:Uncharacterized protein n=1 Tax=Nesidiocoris tenuis TaxID=355587 RepID=A0ABN7B764_9HEMI|nr:Hypothetical protein NTJ_11846 [Nesidiocoris tenuis]
MGVGRNIFGTESKAASKASKPGTKDRLESSTVTRLTSFVLKSAQRRLPSNTFFAFSKKINFPANKKKNRVSNVITIHSETCELAV